MKMLCFKLNKNRTINEEIDFLEKGRGGGGSGAPGEPSIHTFISQLCLVST